MHLCGDGAAAVRVELVEAFLELGDLLVAEVGRDVVVRTSSHPRSRASRSTSSSSSSSSWRGRSCHRLRLHPSPARRNVEEEANGRGGRDAIPLSDGIKQIKLISYDDALNIFFLFTDSESGKKGKKTKRNKRCTLTNFPHK